MAFDYRNPEILRALAGTSVGGGIGALTDVHPSDADVTVATREELLDALDGSAAVIAIDGDARIDLSGRDYILDGQTLVSDRGLGGSPGALLFTTDHGSSSPAWDGGSNGRGLITLRGDSRLVGLRLRGPYHDHSDDPRYPGYIPLDDGDAKERARKRQQRYARGVRVMSDGVRVANCELYGWPNQAISVGAGGTVASPQFEGLYIHDCMMAGAGYGIDVFRGHPTIRDVYCNATRHSVDGFGYADCGYTLENSVFGPISYSHTADMHCLGENLGTDDLTAGGRVEVRDCTFMFTHGTPRDNGTQALAFRGYPEDQYITENCWFAHEIEGEEPVKNVANEQGVSVPYRQVNVESGWHDWAFHDNRYGPGPYQASYGASVDFEDQTIPDGSDDTDDIHPALYRQLDELEASLVRLRRALEQ